MNEYKKKVKRGCNYTPVEKEQLMDIVKERISIIENKSTTGEMIKQKQDAWQQIANQFNLVASSGPRTWQQLRHLYENIKQRTKKNMAIGKKQQYYPKDMKIKQENDPLYVFDDNDMEENENIEHLQNMQIAEPMIEITENVDKPTNPDLIGNKERVRINYINTNAITNIKEQYFKIKLGNAKLERKHLIQKHKLEIHLLKLKIRRLTLSRRK